MVFALPFLLLPVAATFGWFMGRYEWIGKSVKRPGQLRHDYFRGLNYLINEQPDKAVDVFIKMLEVDSDTVETHLALGSLFRRRGEVYRAIRIHQNLIARPQLNKEARVQALSALGQDYLRAGVLDRAERLFLELVEMGEENVQSLHFLLHIYQQEKDWGKAVLIAKKLQSINSEPMNAIIAHYYCELAIQMKEKGYISQAYHQLKMAKSADPQCVRASLIFAVLESDAGNYKEAIRYYKKVKYQDPDYLTEIVAPLCYCYEQLGQQDQLIAYFQECLVDHPRISIVLAISDYLQRSQNDKAAIEFIATQIQRSPSLRGVSHLVGLYLMNASGDTREKLNILQNFMHLLLKEKPVYRCTHCGFSGKILFWLCPSCHHWATVKPIAGFEGC